MTTSDFIEKAFWGLAGCVCTGLMFLVRGGLKRGNAETDIAIIKGIKDAADFLVSSNTNLQESIINLTQTYEQKITDLVTKFELKEKYLLSKIDNLEIQNENLKLENANLILLNNKLSKDTRALRKIN